MSHQNLSDLEHGLEHGVVVEHGKLGAVHRRSVVDHKVLVGHDLLPWIEAESAKLNNKVGEWKKFMEANQEAGKKKYGLHSYKEVAERLEKDSGDK